MARSCGHATTNRIQISTKTMKYADTAGASVPVRNLHTRFQHLLVSPTSHARHKGLDESRRSLNSMRHRISALKLAHSSSNCEYLLEDCPRAETDSHRSVAVQNNQASESMNKHSQTHSKHAHRSALNTTSAEVPTELDKVFSGASGKRFTPTKVAYAKRHQSESTEGSH